MGNAQRAAPARSIERSAQTKEALCEIFVDIFYSLH
jgi:hypothetical protein